MGHQTIVDSHYDVDAQHRSAMPCVLKEISHGHNAMAHCYEAGPDSEVSNMPKPWHRLSHQCGEGTLMHQSLGQLVGTRCLAQKALIKDMLMGTRSQEAPCGEGGSLLGGLSSNLVSKA